MTEEAKFSRPGISSDAVHKSAKSDIVEVLKKCSFACDVVDGEWDDLSNLRGCEQFDGYQIMRMLEKMHGLEGCFADVEELNRIGGILRHYHDLVMKEWVRENNITVPYDVGDLVVFNFRGMTKTGTISFVDANAARVWIKADDGVGSPVVNVEDIRGRNKEIYGDA